MADNPPAFPTPKPLDGWGDPNQGMTLRDWFAGQALAGLLAKHEYGGPEFAAKHAYQMAEAMLDGRVGRGGDGR